MKKTIRATLLAAVLLLALATAALAAGNDLVPSIEAKPAPAVVAVTTEDGTQAAALIHTAEGTEVARIPAGVDAEEIVSGEAAGGLVVTPVAEMQSAADPTVRETLAAAYEEIRSADSLAELDPTLNAGLAERGSELTAGDLVVRDLVDVALYGTYEEAFEDPANHLTLTFDMQMKQGDLLIVMTKCPGEDWVSIPQEDVVINADGSATVTFRTLCPVAFLTDAAYVPADPAVTSPQTGFRDVTPLWFASAVFAAAALLCAAALWRRRAGVRG